GIRDFHVTGVQTCALPIFIIEDDGKEPFRVTVTFSDGHVLEADRASFVSVETDGSSDPTRLVIGMLNLTLDEMTTLLRRDAEQRSEERRVGKEETSRRTTA